MHSDDTFDLDFAMFGTPDPAPAREKTTPAQAFDAITNAYAAKLAAEEERKDTPVLAKIARFGGTRFATIHTLILRDDASISSEDVSAALRRLQARGLVEYSAHGRRWHRTDAGGAASREWWK